MHFRFSWVSFIFENIRPFFLKSSVTKRNMQHLKHCLPPDYCPHLCCVVIITLFWQLCLLAFIRCVLIWGIPNWKLLFNLWGLTVLIPLIKSRDISSNSYCLCCSVIVQPFPRSPTTHCLAQGLNSQLLIHQTEAFRAIAYCVKATCSAPSR